MTKQNSASPLWIFDLDGTLTDSFPSYRRSVEEIFQSYGFTLSDDQLRELLGSNPRQFFAKHLGEARAAEAHAELNRQSVDRAAEVVPYQGIPEMLTSLEKRGHRLAVWTARDRASADRVLQTSGLYKFFRHWVSGCCVEKTKPFPDGALSILRHYDHHPGAAFMIGDHDHDMQGAKAAGIPGIRVGWNTLFGTGKCLLADRQFHNVTDFRKWVDSQG